MENVGLQKITFFRPTCPKMFPEGPWGSKSTPLGPLWGSLWPQLGPYLAQLGPKLAPFGARCPPKSPRKPPTAPQNPPRRRESSPEGPQGCPGPPQGSHLGPFGSIWYHFEGHLVSFGGWFGGVTLGANPLQETWQTHFAGNFSSTSPQLLRLTSQRAPCGMAKPLGSARCPCGTRRAC